jgi:hypothetical protein
VGWLHARAGEPRSRSRALQIVTGAAAASLMGVAWIFALRSAGV